jgi:Family of unknown function (DUF6527)
MKISAVEPEFVEFIPANLTEGKLYISMVFATTVHLCACGCRNKVVAPLSLAEWQLYFDGESVSLTPSIGNWEYPCLSHYWIKANRIRWAAPWTNDQISAGRRRDAEALDDYFAGKTPGPHAEDRSRWNVTPGNRFLRKFREWLSRLS